MGFKYREQWGCGLMILTMIYICSTPNVLLGLIADGTWQAHLFRSYAEPLVLGTLLSGLLLITGHSRPTASVIAATVACVGASLVYVGLDWFHYGVRDGILSFGKVVLYNKVIATFLVVPLVYAICALAAGLGNPERTLRIAIFATTVFASVAMLISVVNRVVGHVIGDHGLTQHNLQAYESVAVLFLVLFLAERIYEERATAIVTLVHGLVPLVLNSRGAMLIALYVLLMYLARQVRVLGWSLFRHLTSAAALLLVVLLSLSVSTSSGLGEAIGLADYLREIVRSSLFRHNLESNSLISLNDSVVSLYSRIGTTILAVKAFLGAPLVGIGIWNAYTDIEVADFGIHGLLPLLLAAYGCIGLAPVAAFALLARPSGSARNVMLHALVALGAISLLVNVFPWWLGLTFWAFGAERQVPGPARAASADHGLLSTGTARITDRPDGGALTQ